MTKTLELMLDMFYFYRDNKTSTKGVQISVLIADRGIS